MRVHSVGIRELESRLSEFVQLAAAGDRVLVTDGERVVAELSAPRAGSVGPLRAPSWGAARVAPSTRRSRCRSSWSGNRSSSTSGM